MSIIKSLNRILLSLFLFSVCLSVSAKQSDLSLSDSAKISLLTCSSGDELYSIFGHSAIRVSDPLRKLDLVFNYGTFDFSDPNFYPNFVRGHLNYILSISYYEDFRESYIEEGRSIYEQRLNIDMKEKQYLFDSLLINYKPENRYYPYDFFNDNCATRIRNIFVEAIPRKISFDYSCFHKGYSFRQLLMPDLKQKPWSKLGINLLLGLPADRVASPWEYMYLPEHLDVAFQHASFSSDSASRHFAQKPIVLLEGRKTPDKFIWLTPLFVLLLVLMFTAYISYGDFKKGTKTLWFDRLLLSLVGLLGLLFTFLWVGTAHKSMVWNFNLLWANPLHLIAIFFLSIKKPRQWLIAYLNINLILLILVLIAWPLLPQALPWAIYPIVMALALRLYILSRPIK